MRLIPEVAAGGSVCRDAMRHPFTILLVEDDDGDAKAIVRALKKARMMNRVERAVDGIEALELLKGQKGRTKLASPPLLIVDLNLPRMNGIELVRSMRQDEDLRRLIVFILTTSKRAEDRAAAYDLNVAGYIAKSTAAVDVLNLVSLLDSYMLLVEMP